MGDIGSLLDRLQSALGRSFLISGFLPAITFLVSNAFMTSVTFIASRKMIDRAIELWLSGNLVALVLLVVFLFIFGLLIWSLNPLLRRVLEGQYLPTHFRNWLTAIQKESRNSFSAKAKELKLPVFQYRKFNQATPPWRQQLRDARVEGDTKPLPSSPAIAAGLLKRWETLDAKRANLEQIPFDEIKSLFNDLSNELRHIPAGKFKELDELQVGFRELFEYALARVENEYVQLINEMAIRFPDDRRMGPTQMANLGEVGRDYALRRYGLDNETLWLSLLKFIKVDDKLAGTLDDAKTQLDFTVVMTFVFGTTAAIWIIPTILSAPHFTWVLASIVAFPLIAIAFYKMSVQNYRAYLEVVNTGVDLCRFELLTALHLKLPADTTAERKLWTDFVSQVPALVYEHKPAKEEADAVPKPESGIWGFLKRLFGKIGK